MAVDPVRDVHVDEGAATPAEEYTAEYEGRTYYFCSEDCKQIFQANPAQYAHKAA